MTGYRHNTKAFVIADVTAWVLMVYAILAILVYCLQTFDVNGAPSAVPLPDLVCVVFFGLAAFLLYHRFVRVGLALLVVTFIAGIVFFSSLMPKVFFSISFVILILPRLLNRPDPDG